MSKKDNYSYFDEFIKLSDCIVKSVEMLNDVFKNFKIQELEEKTEQMHSFENEADKIIHKMRNYLIKDFLPPIDREDIIKIGNKLDDIEDSVDEILINVKILNVQKVRKEVLELTELLLMSAKAVKEIFMNFRSLKKTDIMKQRIIEVNDIEEKGDKVYEKLMTELYKNEKDAIKLIKWTKIYNSLEETIDFCEQLSDCIEDVILVNS